MEVPLGLGKQLGRDATHVVEGATAEHPGDRGVAATVDRTLDGLSGLDIHHVEQGLLVAADRELVGDAVALLRRLPAVERGDAARVEDHRVDEDALRAVGVDDVQDGELLAGLAADEEVAVTAPVRRRHGARTEQFLHATGEVLASSPAGALIGHQTGLVLKPLRGTGVVGRLEPAIGVGDGGAVEVIDEVQAVGGRVYGGGSGRGHIGNPRLKTWNCTT